MKSWEEMITNKKGCAVANDNEDVSEPIKLDHEDGSEATYGSRGLCENVNWWWG